MPAHQKTAQDDNARLRDACEGGLRRVFGLALLEAAHLRLEHELRLIEQHSAANQFLAIAGVVQRIRDKEILVGPGYGSAASALVCYLLGITRVDPLKYDLLFERFLPREGDLIDVDIDVPASALDDVAGSSAEPSHHHRVVELGNLSIDVRGLRALDLLTMTLRLVDAELDPNEYFCNLPLDDEETFRELSSGRDHGIFQVASTGARTALHDVKLESLDSLATVVAMYRPGGFAVFREYTLRTNGEAGFEMAPELRGILDSTHGLIVYQEQLMHLAMQIGGLSGTDANTLRRALGRHEAAKIADLRVRFFEGAASRGFSTTLTEGTWSSMVQAVNWAFCRSHAVSYAMLTYWDAYLEAHFPDQRAVVRKQLAHG